MGDIKIISKEYGSKAEAAYKILNKTHDIVIPHILYLVKFLRKGEKISFRIGYNNIISDGNNNVITINSENLKIKKRENINIELDFKNKIFSVSCENNQDARLDEFKNHVSENCTDPQKIAICDGLIRYAEILQEELWEIEVMDNKIDIFKKTLAKRDVIVEKSEKKEE